MITIYSSSYFDIKFLLVAEIIFITKRYVTPKRGIISGSQNRRAETDADSFSAFSIFSLFFFLDPPLLCSLPSLGCPALEFFRSRNKYLK